MFDRLANGEDAGHGVRRLVLRRRGGGPCADEAFISGRRLSGPDATLADQWLAVTFARMGDDAGRSGGAADR